MTGKLVGVFGYELQATSYKCGCGENANDAKNANFRKGFSSRQMYEKKGRDGLAKKERPAEKAGGCRDKDISCLKCIVPQKEVSGRMPFSCGLGDKTCLVSTARSRSSKANGLVAFSVGQRPTKRGGTQCRGCIKMGFSTRITRD